MRAGRSIELVAARGAVAKFRVGDQVELVGLSSKGMNGQRGIVLSVPTSANVSTTAGRYTINLKNSNESVALKGVNLKSFVSSRSGMRSASGRVVVRAQTRQVV